MTMTNIHVIDNDIMTYLHIYIYGYIYIHIDSILTYVAYIIQVLLYLNN